MLYDIADTEEVFRWYRDTDPATARRAQRLDRGPGGPVGGAVPRGAVGDARSAASSGATPARRTGPTRCWPRCGSSGHRVLMGLQAMPFAVLQSAFDGLLPTGLQWYWKADIFEEITDEAIALHRGVRREHPDAAVDDAPLPDQRGGGPGARGRHGVRLPSRRLERRDRRHRPRPRQPGRDHRLGPALLGGPASVSVGRRRT